MNITVQSYDGRLDFGFLVDRDLVPDVWMLTDLIHESMQELLHIARAASEPLQARPRRKSASKSAKRSATITTVR